MSTARAAFLSRPHPVEAVALPDGTGVHVRALTVAELGRLHARIRDLPPGPDRDERAGVWLCTAALCAADGVPFFPALGDDDFAAVGGRPAAEVEAIAAAAGPLNRPDKDAAKN